MAWRPAFPGADGKYHVELTRLFSSIELAGNAQHEVAACAKTHIEIYAPRSHFLRLFPFVESA